VISTSFSRLCLHVFWACRSLLRVEDLVYYFVFFSHFVKQFLLDKTVVFCFCVSVRVVSLIK
jgi:hypothetical protein